MASNPKEPWFGPRRFGYGSGVPIRWQGWAVLGAYLLVVFLAVQFLAAMFKLALIIVASLILMRICSQRTVGGWRWRWGGKP